MVRIGVVATGGTIANTSAGRLTMTDLLEDIARRYPDDDPRAQADLEIEEVMRAGAESFRPSDWARIARVVERFAAEPSIDGIVVTHGTYTAEETAYALHLSVPTEKPVVVVCSQRKHGIPGNDGDLNLIHAIQVARSPGARGLGVVVVLNEEIHSARDVSKTSRRPSGFRSDSSGILGTIDRDQVTIYRHPTRRHTHRSDLRFPEGDLSRVDIVSTYAGADGVVVEALIRAGTNGIVVDGFSFNGMPHQDQRPSLERAVENGIPVVLVNRGRDGRVPAPLEGLDGFIRGDNLTAPKARVLLLLALASGKQMGELQQVFDEY